MDPAPIWTDLKSFPWAEFRDRVDILTGGYPCQPFSAAGKRLGTDDPRHLWPFIADGIRILRPKLCFFENVEGHISLGLREVVGELEQIGYQAAWGIFSASEVGAPHQRKRVFILAYDQSQRIQGHWADWLQEPRPHAGQGLPLRCGDAGCGELADAIDAWPSRPGEPQHGWEPPRVVANPVIFGRRGRRDGNAGGLCGEIQTAGSCGGGTEVFGNSDSLDRSASPEGWEHDSEAGSASERQAQSPLGRVAPRRLHGVDLAELSGLSHQELAEICEWMALCDNRTDELRLLGNGVVPATAERAFRILIEELITMEGQE